jgi:hypothetical protein
VDLARLAGLGPAGAICEVMKKDGTMARVPDLEEFSERHGIKTGVVLVVASVVAMRSLQVLSARKRGRSALHRARHLTPEKIVAYKGPARSADTRELLSRRIIARAEQIQWAQSTGSSEIEIGMCAMGYSACADDLLTLIELAGEQFPKSGPVRRLRMLAAVRRATDSLALTRRAFPPRTRAGAPAEDTDKDAR